MCVFVCVSAKMYIELCTRFKCSVYVYVYDFYIFQCISAYALMYMKLHTCVFVFV